MAIWLEGGSQITCFKTTTLFSVSLSVKMRITIEQLLQGWNELHVKLYEAHGAIFGTVI